MSFSTARILLPEKPIVRDLPPGKSAMRAAGAIGFILLALVLPLTLSDYWFSAILIPLLILSLAGLGLNLLTGYTGQLSLGSAAFMAVGVYTAYNLDLRVPELPLLVSILGGGVMAALIALAFGLPSLRIKGFYLLVSTLAAQFLIQWVLVKFGWFSNYNPSGVISAPELSVFGIAIETPIGRYLLTLAIVATLFWVARNLVKGDLGRRWMAVRDKDVAAATLGIPLLRTKLLAFAISGFFLGVAGCLWGFLYLGTVEPHGFDLNRSFQILFIIIIGGLGSLTGSILGAAFFVFLPIALSNLAGFLPVGTVDNGLLENLQQILFGVLIIFFLIREPGGLVRYAARAIQFVQHKFGIARTSG
uniref:Branched-chain amino acid ABC transporter permease n=1 Tax=Marinobacter nauticus TaxID=2743 RepID=A0A455W5G3_MARNT|nr:branched-chain amino acid ABC transporter permease [Marinobacter nauticus]